MGLLSVPTCYYPSQLIFVIMLKYLFYLRALFRHLIYSFICLFSPLNPVQNELEIAFLNSRDQQLNLRYNSGLQPADGVRRRVIKN